VKNNMMQQSLIPGDHVLVTKFTYGYNSNSVIPIFKFLFKDNSLKKKIFYEEPSRSHIVLYIDNQKKYRMSRVIGKSGDFVKIDEDKLTINNQTINYKLLDRYHVRCKKKKIRKFKYKETLFDNSNYVVFLNNNKKNNFEIKVPKNYFLLLNDNRGCMYKNENFNSYLIKKENIIGRAQFILFSLDQNLSKIGRLNLFKFFNFTRTFKKLY
tara:strand:- start:30294 stop:30926 length:633 start_codon:yes stop_codon:yes gene_type:complete